MQAGAPAWPLLLYMPRAHCAVADTDPGAQLKPASQAPLHSAVVRPLVPPYTPEGQSWQALALVLPGVGLKVPKGHCTCCAEVLRAGQ